MSQENVELIRGTYEALSRGLEAALARAEEVADPEIEWRAVGRLPDTPGRLRGREPSRP